MTDLERALERLAADIEWPATPALDLRRPERRRWWLAAVAAAVLAIGIAFAVPPARSALLRLFHVGGVTVRRVDTLPPAQERPLASSLGVPVSDAEAAQLLGRPFALPEGVHPRLYRSGESVSALLATPGPVLLTELVTGEGTMILKKLASASTGVRPVVVAPHAPAVWITGAPHVYLAPPLPARLAGNTLLWVRGPVTYRLEGGTLTLETARRLAQEIGAG